MLFRLYRITQEIQLGNYPGISDLASILEVSERTIDRYIEALRDDFGAPIAYDRKRRGYYFEYPWSMPFSGLSEGEALALFIFLNVAERFRGTPLEEAFNRLGERLSLALPDNLQMSREEFDMLLSPFLMPLAMRVDVSETFSAIFRAVTERKRVLIRYHSLSSREVSERKVDPYHLYNFEGVWYFCGFCHLRDEVRDFALDRIEEVKVLEESFERPRDFSPQEYFNRAFRMYRGDLAQVRIRFDSYQTAWIKERIWHPTQKIEELPDGGVVFTVCANPEEIKRWVIGYGAHAEVLEPTYLRKEIQEEVAKLQKIYHSDRK
ncbi:helix-turn-helix transcriptional regulator [Atrimonas thermophila]|uniref:helix-turn-helix transcriptional regulator n=1 Tax=Atrimonas thermophila TaxID=3064161 RepID=UPI00399C8A43